MQAFGFPDVLKEKVAFADEAFAAGLAEDDVGLAGVGEAEADAAGEVGFDHGGDDVGFGELGGEDEVNAGGAAFGADAGDARFDFGAGFFIGDEVEVFVAKQNDAREGLAGEGDVGGKIVHAFLLEEEIAVVHFVD